MACNLKKTLQVAWRLSLLRFEESLIWIDFFFFQKLVYGSHEKPYKEMKDKDGRRKVKNLTKRRITRKRISIYLSMKQSEIEKKPTEMYRSIKKMVEICEYEQNEINVKIDRLIWYELVLFYSYNLLRKYATFLKLITITNYVTQIWKRTPLTETEDLKLSHFFVSLNI